MTDRWVSEHQNVLLCGPTGICKTLLACALANQACRQDHSVLYVRLTRLLPTLAIGRGDGSYLKSLAQLAKTENLVIDEWALAPLTDESHRHLLEIFDDRQGTHSTIVTSQLPVKHWYAAIGDPTLADAILGRWLLHSLHVLDNVTSVSTSSSRISCRSSHSNHSHDSSTKSHIYQLRTTDRYDHVVIG